MADDGHYTVNECGTSTYCGKKTPKKLTPMPEAVISFILESRAFLKDWNLGSSFAKIFKSKRFRSSRKCRSKPHDILYNEFAG